MDYRNTPESELYNNVGYAGNAVINDKLLVNKLKMLKVAKSKGDVGGSVDVGVVGCFSVGNEKGLLQDRYLH